MLMKIWKLGGLTIDMILVNLLMNRYSDEDAEYIETHYDSVVVNID